METATDAQKERQSFWSRILHAAKPHLQGFDYTLFAISAAVVLGYLYLRDPQNFWAEFNVRMLEVTGILFLVAIVFVWAGLKMEPHLEPSRRRFLAGMMVLGSGAMFWFGRASRPELPQSASDEELWPQVKKTPRAGRRISSSSTRQGSS